MALSDATISNVRVSRHFADLVVTWDSTSPAGTVYQVYVDRVLAWHGAADRFRVVLDTPPGARGEVFVGTCLDSEAGTDLSGSIPAPPGGGTRPRLEWYGGTYEGDDIQGFHVYAPLVAGGLPDLTRPAATVPAYPGGFITDGAGVGPAGIGGAGRSAQDYVWVGNPLGPGTWGFLVKSFDSAGNEDAGTSFSVTVVAPPAAPAPFPDGARLHAVLNAGRTVTLSWNPP